MNKKITSMVLSLLVIALIMIITSIPTNDPIIKVEWEACVDGDTAKFKTASGIETVRFLAIDTPETVDPKKDVEPFGPEASTFTCNELKNAKEIFLELDSNSDMYDKYNRLLAWVFVDGSLLQEKIITLGYAKIAYLYDDYKYTNILLQKEKVAKAKKVGIWYNEQ